MRRAGAIGTLFVLILAVAVPALGDHVSDGGVDQVWSEPMNHEPFWESYFTTAQQTADCTKFENHSGDIPEEYEAAVIKDGNMVRVYASIGGAFTALGAVNPANDQHFPAPHSWVMKCNFYPIPTTTLIEETTTTTEETTTTTEATTTTTTTEGSTTTTEQGGTTTTVEGGSTTTTEGGTTTTTVVGVNPICIDCNNATQADLMQLTGVNAPLALAIIANRPYETLQDLVTKQVMTGPQLLLIIAVNLNTGAFAGPECLNAAIGVTTTTVAGDSTTTIAPTTSTPGNLPFTGIDVLRYGVAGGSVILVGLLIVLSVRQRRID